MMLILFMVELMLISFFCWLICNFFFINISCFFIVLMGYSEFVVWGSNCYFAFDSLSWSLIILSVWITDLLLLDSYSALGFSKNVFFTNMVVLLCLFLCLTSMILDYIYFYIFFEGSLIPIFLLVMGWGSISLNASSLYYICYFTLYLAHYLY